MPNININLIFKMDNLIQKNDFLMAKDFKSCLTKTLIGATFDIFERLIESKGTFVDKSLFIKQILEDIQYIILITCPRRYGKSLNITMLESFIGKNKGPLLQSKNI